MATSKASEATRNESEKSTLSKHDQAGRQGDAEGHDGTQQEEAPTRSSKKRTKSGCLTCRKRRIKCDEARPICQNCIKSKRHCDGYYQRVLFKPANIDFRHFQNGATAITFPPGTLAMPFDFQALQQQSISAGQSQLRPRPVPEYAPVQPYSQPYHGSHIPPQNFHPNVMTGDAHQFAHSQAPVWTTLGHDNLGPVAQPTNLFTSQQPAPPPMILQQPFVPPSSETISSGSMARRPSELAQNIPSNLQQSHPTEPVPNTRRASRVRLDKIPSPRVDSASRVNSISKASSPRQTVQKPRDSVTSDTQLDRKRYDAPTHFTVDQASPDHLLREAATEVQDDDYYDVNSDDEMAMELDSQTAPDEQHKLHRNLGLVMRVGQLDLNESLGIHTPSNLLDTYRPERTANPLRNAMTARVFAHFIRITAPTIATFVRRPKQNKAPAQGNGTIPFSEQGIWTFAMPMAALHHQGLLQAILAISSFHIARLTGASTTPSYKHYAYALKRIHASLSHPEKRHSVPVLAASLLLAVYELWSADHVKWNSHLAGAGQLLAEIDFRSTYKRFRKLKAEQIALLHQQQSHSQTKQRPSFDARLWSEISQVPEIDAGLVSVLSGRVVNYDEYGHVESDDSNQASEPSPLDIPRFEMQKDLFWWFAKQDVVQCLVSGNPLIMPYSRWTNCPPRAPPGDPQASYGSFDHVLLLLGRVADFTVRDRKRKLQKMQATGGHWRPPPGMQMGPAPPAGSASVRPPGGPTPSPSSQGTPSPPRMPDFFGMAPVPPQSGMPSSYSQHALRTASVSPIQTDHVDLELKTRAALNEWEQIRNAVLHFRSTLGPDYQPLETRSFQTPFGPALVYRSYDISCLWSYYFLTMIVLVRAHPDMPPHAQVAAGVAAYQTREFANDIGRAAAAFTLPPEQEIMTPTLMAAITDHSLPMFFAGVQYQSPLQREWLVTRMYDVERRCGFASAGTMALGCQGAWIKAFEAGRGPPHEMRFNVHRVEDHFLRTSARDQGRYGTIDPEAEEDDCTDRRFVKVKPEARMHWGIGLLGTEDDG
ncbi:hypothetical protein MBLNU457_4806t1 [Dothideomycetes sp. NU457]